MADAGDKVLLLVAHGSRREVSNEEVRELTARLARRLAPGCWQVRHAFLELASPSVPEGIDEAVVAGARHITLLPYFLVDGRHVAADLPQIVAAKQRQYPQVLFEQADYLGKSEGVLDILAAMVNERR